MATVTPDTGPAPGRAAEIALGVLGAAMALAVLFIALDLASDGALTRLVAGEPAPRPEGSPRGPHPVDNAERPGDHGAA